MRKYLRLFAVPVLLVALVWILAIIWFQQFPADTSNQALLAGFVLAPLGALVLWFGGKALIGAMTHKAPADPAQTAAAASPETPDVPTRHSLLAILAAEVRTTAGDDPAQLTAALQAGDLQPGLSTRHVNAEGLPVFAGLDDSLDTDSGSAFIEHWMQNAPADHPVHQDPEQAARVLALLAPPLQNALAALGSIPQAATTAGTEAPQRPVLVKMFVPAVCEDLVEAWLRVQLAELPQFRFGFIRKDPQHPELHHDALRVADAFRKDVANMPAGSLLLLVASDSLGSATHIDQLDASGQLFGSANQQGLIPGEAATAVLACAAEQVPEGLMPLALQQPAAWNTRASALPHGGRADSSTLEALLAVLLEQSGTPGDSIQALVSDCDQRAAWVAESAALISASLPGLDPVADHLPIGRALGCTGSAGSALALACAAGAASASGAPHIAASLADPAQRSLALILPWPETRTDFS